MLVFGQELLSDSQTDANLEGDLGNTPVNLAALTDNHEALCILVLTTQRPLR